MANKNAILRKIVAPKPKKNDGAVPGVPWWKPTIRFKYAALPEAKDWTVGKTYRLHLEVEQESADKEGATFEVTKVGVDDGGTDGKK